MIPISHAEELKLVVSVCKVVFQNWKYSHSKNNNDGVGR